MVIDGIPEFQADFLVSYDRPLLKEAGEFSDIGDMGEAQAMDTISVEGLFIHPLEASLERSDGGVQIAPGLPAHFRVTRDREGQDELWRFLGGPPAEMRNRR